MPVTNGISVLDAGCGDGAFLAEVLRCRPGIIRLEDVSAEQLARARARLEPCSDEVAAVQLDAFRDVDDAYDTVLAIGVLDYQDAIPVRLSILLSRASGRLIVTIPRPHIRNCARRLWLKAFGVSLSAMSLAEVELLAQRSGAHFEIAKGPFEWLICVSGDGDQI